MVVFRGVVQHRIELDFVDLGHRADVARHALRYLDVVLALEQEQVSDLERLAAVADVELAVAGDRALVDPEHAHLADVRIDGYLEHVREHMFGGSGSARSAARHRLRH